MRSIKKIVKGLIIVLVSLNLLVIISGKTYLYKGIANTYFKGRSGPSIDEYATFPYREVKAGQFQKWPVAKSYNKISLPEKYRADFKKYETTSFIIIKDDSVCYEQYWDGFGENSITNSFSMAKTFVGILLGIAIDEGKIKNIDEPVGNYLPEFREGANFKLKIKHLLTMSSGINFDEDYVSPFAYPAAAYYGSDIEKLTLKYKVTEEPGKVFRYLSGNSELLAMVVEKATGKTISEYASEKLWIPLGAKNAAYWGLDHENGMEKAFCCFNSNALDFARIGQLYLKKGNWKGKQLISENYVLNSIQPADLVNKKGNKNEIYGYAWWLMKYNNHNIFSARGILGQYIIVIPDKNMVVVRLGKKREEDNEKGHPADVFKYIDAALEMYADD